MKIDEFEAEIKMAEKTLSKKYGNFSDNISSKNVLERYYMPLKDVTLRLMQAEIITLYMYKSFKKLPVKVLKKDKKDILKVYKATEKLKVLLDCLLSSLADIFMGE